MDLSEVLIGRMMGVAADHTVDTQAQRFYRQGVLEGAGADIFLLVVGATSRLILYSKSLQYPATHTVKSSCCLDCKATKNGEPVGASDYGIESIPVNDQITLPVGQAMYGAFGYLDPAELQSNVAASELVVVSGHVDDTCPLPRLAEEFLHDVIV